MIGHIGALGMALRGRELACVLAAGMLVAGCTTLHGELAVRAGFGLLVTRYDADRDGGLNRAEIETMVDAAIAPERRQGAGWAALRAWLVARYLDQDMDHDGRVRADELARAPVAAFHCLDADASGRVTPGEAEARWAGCVIDNL
ncbi:MAG: hypothetical protein J7500_05385 [Sphingomonas sp.]|uniref:hypothetical protein n=1 Tax=Sphingomonas sp. TaxID=28214 RepID=UPI001B02544D|nr:hypothetical protein [Sphingomonas sp.]MBO9622127.1 hypothetical protein [Sphingomonas sp.]